MPKAKKINRKKATTNLATWNVHGHIKEKVRREELAQDMMERKISIAGIQETRWKENATCPEDGGIIYNLNHDGADYLGLGFYVSNEWVPRLVSMKIVTSRIAVARFSAYDENSRRGDLVIINIYGPTMMRRKDNPGITEAFYNELRRIYDLERQGALSIFIVGDFNSKIGMRGNEDEEDFMGQYGKGERNENGEDLRDFLETTQLYLANTHFKHRDHHVATWHGGRPSRNNRRRKEHESPGIHNQIDYIAVPKREINLITDARAYNCMRVRSDHSMVVASVLLHALYKLKPVKRNTSPIRDLGLLATDEELRTDYENVVAGKLGEPAAEIAAEERYEQIKKIVRETADETLPIAPRKEYGKIRFFDDKEIKRLSDKQRRLTRNLYRMKGKKTKTKRKRVKKERNLVFKELRARQKYLNEERMKSIATELEENKGNSRAFEFARIMSKNKTESFALEDEEKATLHNKQQKLTAVLRFYEDFFNREDANALDPWRGAPRPLEKIVDAAEVSIAAKRLRNRRALGPDEVAGEHIKYGGETLHKAIADMFNSIFTRHETIMELKQGYLFPLNKPDKLKIVSNTRPLVFLPTLRKVMSSIVLHRIMPKVNEYVSLNQHAYRSKRSTTESIWTTQWLYAMSERYEERIHLMGIDLSKAFDCLDREKLMRILEEIGITDDELRMITFLLAETKLQVKIGADKGEIFDTTIGTPQGDALSPVLFLVYLEHILRTNEANHNLMLQREITFAYADDVNFATIDADMRRTAMHNGLENAQRIEGCQCAACRAYEMEIALQEDMAEYNMTMNIGKTEHHEFTPGKKPEMAILRSYIEREKELKNRKAKAQAAFNAMQRIWMRGLPISIETKVRLYNCCVKSRLLYNAGATAYTQIQLDKLDSFHRSHLRRMLGVFYPNHIGNKEVYEQTKTGPISAEIVELRWTALGHNLRLPQDTPANKVMIQYYRRRMNNLEEVRKTSRRGRVLTTIPRLLQLDLQRLSKTSCFNNFNIHELSSGTDLATLRLKAQNQQLWRKGVDAVTEAYKRKWNDRENKKTRYNPAVAQQGGGGQQGGARRGRGRGRPRGRGRQHGQRSITAYFDRMEI